MRIDAHLMRIGIWIRMPIPSTSALPNEGCGIRQRQIYLLFGYCNPNLLTKKRLGTLTRKECIRVQECKFIVRWCKIILSDWLPLQFLVKINLLPKIFSPQVIMAALNIKTMKFSSNFNDSVEEPTEVLDNSRPNGVILLYFQPIPHK